jgi:hypothetical protein
MAPALRVAGSPARNMVSNTGRTLAAPGARGGGQGAHGLGAHEGIAIFGAGLQDVEHDGLHRSGGLHGFEAHAFVGVARGLAQDRRHAEARGHAQGELAFFQIALPKKAESFFSSSAHVLADGNVGFAARDEGFGGGHAHGAFVVFEQAHERRETMSRASPASAPSDDVAAARTAGSSEAANCTAMRAAPLGSPSVRLPRHAAASVRTSRLSSREAMRR